MKERPRVTVLAVDPNDVYYWIEIRGRVVETVEGQEAVDHIESLSQLYRGRSYYNGPATEQRCIYKIEPARINYRGQGKK